MSTKKIPMPTYTNAPAGIIDLSPGRPFRIEIYGSLGLWGATSGPLRFKFLNGIGEEYHLWEHLSHKERDRFDAATALWSWNVWRSDDPCPEMPHRAIWRVLDLLTESIEKKAEERQKEWDAAHPESASTKAGSVIAQLRKKARDRVTPAVRHD